MFFQIVNKYTVTLALMLPAIISGNVFIIGAWLVLLIGVLLGDILEISKW
jgi:hypothetical protein